jgi:uncharacterized protein (TIGR02246 family)
MADASLTSISGNVYYGRQAVEERMTELFSTVFKSSRIVKKVQNVRFIHDDIAIVDIDTEIMGYRSLPPGVRAHPDGAIRTRLQQVKEKDPGDREDGYIAAFHNVDVKTP